MFKYITKLMPIESSKNFVSVWQYVEINNQSYAAAYDKYYAAKQLTNLVLEINNDIDFTKPFLFACSANALDICDFFLKKKVHLNIIVISTNDQISIFLREDIMFKLIDLVDEPFKRSAIDSFLIGSIKSLKLKTVQKLLEENVPNESLESPILILCILISLYQMVNHCSPIF